MRENMSKEERVKETTKLFTKTLDYYESETFGFDQSILQRLEENGAFYVGVGQWPEHTKKRLEQDMRAALTINKCAPIVNMISGFEIQNRTAIKPYPFETDDETRAFVMEYIFKHVHGSFKSEFGNSEGFQKGIISSEANWEYSIDIGDDGFPVLERDLLPVGSVLWDPLSVRYDRKDAMYCIHNSWIGIDELLQLSPRLEGKKLENYEDKKENRGIKFVSSYDNYRTGKDKNSKLYDDVNHKIRLIRCWRKHYEKEFLIYDRANPAEMKRMDEEQIKEIDIENPTFVIRPRLKPIFSYHMVSGDEELARIDDISLNRIPIVPFYCFYYEGIYFSIIDLAKDRQMQINKTDSVMHDYLARLPKLSAMAEESVFMNDGDRERFDNANVGDSLVFADGALREGKVVFPNIRGLEIISYYSALKESMNKELKECTVPSDAMQGIKPKDVVSGTAINSLISQGLVIIEPIMNNYQRTKEMMGELEAEMIQKFFPPEKIERILGSLAIRYKDDKYLSVWNEARDDENERAKLVDTLMTSKYDIVIDKGLNTPTIKQANSIYFNDLLKNGFPVPPEIIIENTEISQDWRELWKQHIQQMQQTGGV